MKTNLRSETLWFKPGFLLFALSSTEICVHHAVIWCCLTHQMKMKRKPVTSWRKWDMYCLSLLRSGTEPFVYWIRIHIIDSCGRNKVTNVQLFLKKSWWIKKNRTYLERCIIGSILIFDILELLIICTDWVDSWLLM